MKSRGFVLLGVGLMVGLAIGSIGVRLVSGSNSRGWFSAASVPLAGTVAVGPSSPSSVASGSSSDWCIEHRVPESACTLCNPALIPPFKAKGDWCNEHQLPESIDRKCHPGLSFAQEPKAETSPKATSLPTVFFPRNAANCATNDALIQFASAATAERVGLTFAPALEVGQTASVEAPAELLFDDTRSLAITTRVPALVSRWLVEPGAKVQAGQVLAELESPEMPKLQSDYLEAMAEAQLREQEFGRADSLRSRGMISNAEIEQLDRQRQAAMARLSGAQGMLEACGLNKSELASIRSEETVTAGWRLCAPHGGTLLERKAHLGELLAAGSILGLLGDPSVLWVEAQVREADLSRFKQGQSVEFSIDGDALDRAVGRVIWVAQFIDPLTRSATVRAEVSNANLKLKAHQYGRMVVPSPSGATAVAVPRDAVQWEGCCNVVFVQEAPDRYRPRKVTVSRGDLGYYNVDSGLKAGDMVVVKGSYLLKTELKKGSLGAGCCAAAPKS
jgi:membrane fusion protein, heavy metal efflux system